MTRSLHGFSLVELLIVVSIIALLAALLLPGLARAKEYAYFARCKNNLRQVGIGFLVYGADNRGSLHLLETLDNSGKVDDGGVTSGSFLGRKIGTMYQDWPRGGTARDPARRSWTRST